MIVGQQKPFDEIWGMVKDFKKVLVFGCNTCVAISHAGGGKEAEVLASMIRMKATRREWTCRWTTRPSSATASLSSSSR